MKKKPIVTKVLAELRSMSADVPTRPISPATKERAARKLKIAGDEIERFSVSARMQAFLLIHKYGEEMMNAMGQNGTFRNGGVHANGHTPNRKKRRRKVT